MHIPDGFLDTKTIIATSLFSLLGVGRALQSLRKAVSRRTVPLMGLAAAFVFVAQMLNFPVVGGTSGHLLGAVLVGVLLGPNAAILVMSVVLVVQCFLFADGGVFSLGANVFNMAIVASVSGYYLYRLVRLIVPGSYGIIVGVAFASWTATVLASICCTGELVWSGAAHWSVGFPAMTGIHMLIGIGEAVITSLVVVAVYQTRPDLFPPVQQSNLRRDARPVTDLLLYGGLLIVGLALFVSPFASPWPDGLERVAASLGFASREMTQRVVSSPIADYQLPGIGSLQWATALAGLAGAVVVFLLSFILARVLLRNTREDHTS